MKPSLLFVLVLFNNGFDLVNSECIATFAPHLLTTNMPPEIRRFVMRENVSEIGGFVKKIIQTSIVFESESARKFKFYSLKEYFQLHTKIKSLHEIYLAKIPVQSLPPSHLQDIQRRTHTNHVIDKFGKMFDLKLNPHHIVYKRNRKVKIFKFQFLVPFQFYINITFAPVPRKPRCSFIFCLEGLLWGSLECCAIMRNSFIPWSVIIQRRPCLTFSVALLYSKEDNCSNTLVKLIYQPINAILKIHSGGIQMRVDFSKCKFNQHAKLLCSKRDNNSPAMYNMHFTVSPRQRITIRASRDKNVCNSTSEPLYLYDGPGVLSHKLQPQIQTDSCNSYQASSYQVCVVRIASMQTVEWCVLQYEGHNISLDTIKIHSTNTSHHWNVNSIHNTLCLMKNQVSFCGAAFWAARGINVNISRLRGINVNISRLRGINVNISRLRGSNHISYSEYDFQQEQQFRPFNIYGTTGTYRDSIGLCYCGTVAIGYWSLGKERQRHHMTPLCTVEANPTQLYGSQAMPYWKLFS